MATDSGGTVPLKQTDHGIPYIGMPRNCLRKSSHSTAKRAWGRARMFIFDGGR